MALYYPPITPRSPIFANSNYAIPNTPVSGGGTGTITEEFLATNYLQFPGAQGVENFGFKELQLNSTNIGETATLYINPNTGQDVVLESVQSNGSLTIQTSATLNNTMVLSPSTGITFGDGTTQDSAFIEANYAQLNTDNTFLPTFTNTFQGTVNLGSSATALTQISGNSSTLLATTAFVQDAVQVSGVQVGDSPLLWSGQNTWQFNSGTPGTLPLTYKYGISNLWNLTGYAGDCDLVCNSGTGANPSAFNIYCVQGDITGTQIQNSIPQFTLSNNGTSAFLKDGLNVNNQNISNINTLSGTTAINFSSPISMNSGNAININNAPLKIYSGTEFSSIDQNSTLNQLTIYNNAPHTDNSANIAFNLNIPSGDIDVPYNVLQLFTNEIDIKTTLNMNNNNITNINTLTGNSTSNITVNSSIGMGTGKSINMNNNSISLISSLSGGSGTTPITINSPLSMSSASNISMNNNNITSMGSGSTAFTQPNGTSGLSIATTAYVQNMYTTQTISLSANNIYYAIVLPFNSFVSSYIQLDNNQYIVTLNTMLSTSNGVIFATNNNMPPNTVNTLTFTFNNGVTVPYAPSSGGMTTGKIVLQNLDTLSQQNVTLIMFNNAVVLTLQNTLYLSPNTNYQLYFIKNNITVG